MVFSYIIKLLYNSINFNTESKPAMANKSALEKRVFELTRHYGMSSVMLRNAVSRKLGLNITDMECLSLLSIKGLSTPKELAQYTGMTSGAATVMLDRLERAGFITRELNPSDRRGLLIKINRKSMKKLGSVFVGAQTAQSNVIGSYSAKELEIIASFLERAGESVAKQADLVTKSSK